MKKRLFPTLLSVAMLLSLSVSAMAVQGMDAFEEATYSDTPYVNPYSDISEQDWFARPVALCDQMGFMRGWNGKFAPHGQLTTAEALTIAARVHQIYQTGTCTLENGAPVWYQPYVDYCLNNGLCSEDMFLHWEDPITRNQMAYVFSHVVPDDELAVLNEDLESYLDIASPALYTEETLKLYRAGVLTGSDAFGTFHPFNPITRCEAAAIITRVALPLERRLVHLLVPVIIAHQNAAALALPQGFDAVSKQAGQRTVYINAGLGITCSVTAASHDAPVSQISEYMTQQELEDLLAARLERDGDRFHFPPHTELWQYGNTDVYMTSCEVEHSDGVTSYPMQLVLVQFILDGIRYQLEYRCIDDFYEPLFHDMIDNLYIDGTTLKLILSTG